MGYKFFQCVKSVKSGDRDNIVAKKLAEKQAKADIKAAIKAEKKAAKQRR